jgi:hypothetical protein
MIANCWLCHASRSKEAISPLQGSHQLAHTLMIRGRPRNALNRRDGPFNPCKVASRNVPPTGTSPGVFAADDCARARQSKRADSHRSISALWDPKGALGTPRLGFLAPRRRHAGSAAKLPRRFRERWGCSCLKLHRSWKKVAYEDFP